MTRTKQYNPKSLQNLNKGGRPVGAKNKTTLFKEVMREGFEKKMQNDFKKVLQVVVDKAIDGDMVAAKMLMDRIIPKESGFSVDTTGKSQINIVIGKLEDNVTIEGEVVE